VNPDHITRKRAKKLVLSTCTVNPQRNEVYDVMRQSIVYVVPQIWVMLESKCGRFKFSCYHNCETSYVNGRVKLKPLTESRRIHMPAANWKLMREEGRARFIGFICPQQARR